MVRGDKARMNSDTTPSFNSVNTGNTDEQTVPRQNKSSKALGGGAGAGLAGAKKKKKRTTEAAAAPIAAAKTVEASTAAAAPTTSHRTSTTAALSLEDQLAHVRDQVQQEKAGKRKLFHSLVKLAHELRKTRDENFPLQEHRSFADKTWYEGGIWRAPTLLPGVIHNRAFFASMHSALLREQVLSLTDLFFALTTVTAFTRVGVAISTQGFVDVNSLLYFGVFWTVWSKETSYSTRFDTTDLSSKAVTLFTCFAVLFASLSVQQPIQSVDGSRIMLMAGFVAALHFLLHLRVLITVQRDDCGNEANTSAMEGDQQGGDTINNNNNNMDEGVGGKLAARAMRSSVTAYAVFNIIMGFLEMTTWFVGVLIFPSDWTYRWLLFLGGVLLALRVPRAFLPNDFHAACSKRGVLFILLLGFLMQSIIVVASEFFAYQTPTWEHYTFVGSACLMLFCMKLLYVDDSDILAEDHALLVNSASAFFFNLGNFSLLLSTTILGSGLNLLTHDYLARTQALPGPSKAMVCAGFAAVLFSTFFIKSMHLKRVPANGGGQCLFITAYLMQAFTLLAVVAVACAMALGKVSGLLAMLMESDILLLAALSGAALVVVIMHWLDEGLDLALYGGTGGSAGRSYRVHAFGLWWCLKPARLDFSSEDKLRSIGSSEGLFADPRFGLEDMEPLLGKTSSVTSFDYKAAALSSSSPSPSKQRVRDIGGIV